MNKNAIQKYAIWARNELIEQVKQRAYQYGIGETGYGDENAAVISGRVLSADETRQRHDFVAQIKKRGYQQTVEEVAYTWFNRFVALRYMEINDYLPTHVRVFSDATGGFNPEILRDVLHLDLEGLDKAKVSELLNANKTEELYRYLLLTQCNALNTALPEMFEKLGGYTEMLLPNNILKQDSILARLVKDIDEDDWKDAVQIIGWMYQYYNTEPKQAVFDGLKKNVKITKEKIPAATQLFTPDWIVRYMVENSLGRLWLESHPNPTLRANWKYYLDEADQTLEVAERLRVLRLQSPVKSPEDIRLIDPCMGSGHILVYAFDMLMQIYESVGVSPRDAAKLILEKNIYGLDIDRRAYQFAYFSLMMKARQYNRRIFTEDIKPQVYHPTGFPKGEEYGSLVKVDSLPPKPVEKTGQLSIDDTSYDLQLNAWNFKRLLAQKYDVVVTNPPYMGIRNMSGKMSDYLSENFPNSKYDSCTAFIEVCKYMTSNFGCFALITQNSWMFINSFDRLREELIQQNCLSSMLHLGYGAFGADFGTTAFVFQKKNLLGYYAKYIRLGDFRNLDDKEANYWNKDVVYLALQEDYFTIPRYPFAYWMSIAARKAFSEGSALSDISTPRQGMASSDNNRFVRFWPEVSFSKIGFHSNDAEEAQNSGMKWFPYNNGGYYRKWYGINTDLVNWEKDGLEVKQYAASLYKSFTRTIKSIPYYFQEGGTWNAISSTSSLSVRYFEKGFIFSNAGMAIFSIQNEFQIEYLIGYLNSKVADLFLQYISPTLNFNQGDIAQLPIIDSPNKVAAIDIAKRCISLSKYDWDSFETSWDFKVHPLVELKEGAGYGTDLSKWNYTIKSAFKNWETSCNDRFTQLKTNEEELNHIFIDIYGLQDELTPEVADKDVTVRRADLGREIRSLISYAVGCMFGRYSLDVEGLAYAGGEWDAGKYRTFPADKDNIIPVCDDEYFDDDIAGRFVAFVKVVYGADTLEENLKFITDALGGRGTPREVIRNYFLNDFYKDHLKIYQKRPIYWLFDSGKKNGFKALIYMHRYARDLLAKLRTDYVHEQQERYRTQIAHIVAALNTATGVERARLLKQQDKLTEQLREITAFEEKVHHLADQSISIDLDDGVKKNYEIFADVLAKM